MDADADELYFELLLGLRTLVSRRKKFNYEVVSCSSYLSLYEIIPADRQSMFSSPPLVIHSTGARCKSQISALSHLVVSYFIGIFRISCFRSRFLCTHSITYACGPPRVRVDPRPLCQPIVSLKPCSGEVSSLLAVISIHSPGFNYFVNILKSNT